MCVGRREASQSTKSERAGRGLKERPGSLASILQAVGAGVGVSQRERAQPQVVFCTISPV